MNKPEPVELPTWMQFKAENSKYLTTEERMEFEVWFMDACLVHENPSSLLIWEKDHYSDSTVQNMWEAWSAGWIRVDEVSRL